MTLSYRPQFPDEHERFAGAPPKLRDAQDATLKFEGTFVQLWVICYLRYTGGISERNMNRRLSRHMANIVQN